MAAATYDATLSSAKDRLRYLLGDTNTEYPLRDDETYTGAVTNYGETGAAVFLAQGLVSEFGQYPVRVDENGVTLDYSDRLKVWQAVASGASALPVVGGVAVGSFSVSLPVRASAPTRDEYGRPTSYRWWPL